MISDGRRFNALVGESDEAVQRYSAQTGWWIERLGISDYVEIADYRDLLGARLSDALLRDKARIRAAAEASYGGLMWPVLDPLQPLKSLSMTSPLEPDPEKHNPGGRFSSLLQSLVFTIRYPCLKRVTEAAPELTGSRYLALYRELTGHLFVRYPDANPCAFDEVLRQAKAGDGLSPDAMECLRQTMLREVWQATIRYMAEIKSDRELAQEPISTCLPDSFRWTIHAKRGQIAIMTPTALGLPVQAWAGTAVFKRSKKGGIRTLPCRTRADSSTNLPARSCAHGRCEVTASFANSVFPPPGRLEGSTVALEPLAVDHREDLRQAAALDPSIWTYFPRLFNGAGDDFDPWFDAGLQRSLTGEHYPFAIRRKADGRIIGTTRYYDMSAVHLRLAIGSTWYTPEARGSLINFEVRLLTMGYAFEDWHVNRIELITDPRNLSSQAAMKLLGAKPEGVIRNHLIYKDGRIRDSLLFSVIASEWPAVRDRLTQRLATA